MCGHRNHVCVSSIHGVDRGNENEGQNTVYQVGEKRIPNVLFHFGGVNSETFTNDVTTHTESRVDLDLTW